MQPLTLIALGFLTLLVLMLNLIQLVDRRRLQGRWARRDAVRSEEEWSRSSSGRRVGNFDRDRLRS